MDLFRPSLDRKDRAEAALSSLLPGQANPWLVLTPEGDPIAYLNVQRMDGGSDHWEIQADMSGRHFHCDSEVLQVLSTLQSRIGGEVGHDV